MTFKKSENLISSKKFFLRLKLKIVYDYHETNKRVEKCCRLLTSDLIFLIFVRASNKSNSHFTYTQKLTQIHPYKLFRVLRQINCNFCFVGGIIKKIETTKRSYRTNSAPRTGLKRSEQYSLWRMNRSLPFLPL